MDKKLISVVVPTYNEQENVVPLTDTLVKIFSEELPEYNYEIIFIDNHSKDNTKALIRQICSENPNVKAIFNARNFGQMRSPVYGFKQAYGDCVVRLNADFQDPPSLIPTFVREWEKGHKIVIGIKEKTEEGFFMAFVRRQYYKFLRKITDIGHIENFTGFGLFDKAFVDVVRNIHDPMPYFRGMVAEFGFEYKTILYQRPNRRAGKSKNHFYTLYDVAMIGITSYSKVMLRLASFLGFAIGGLSFLVALVYFILKLVHWDWFRSGIAPLVIGVFFLGGVQLFFIGLLGEYVLAINSRVLDRPLVVEEERLNFNVRPDPEPDPAGSEPPVEQGA
ncbi:MAG: glycosyltransferase family 2 protein [Lachnospiraceae bacterium]|nr:glycosyltransferase family 2 protein [Lachnospiraceae bacterium]